MDVKAFCEQIWGFLPKCILIVDDNTIVRRNLRAVFESIDGWEVCGEAVDGRDAIEKAQQLRPDLIVLDLSMPVMNGFDAARVLCQMMPTVPLLMYSALTDKFMEQAALAAGVRAVVSKTDDMKTLVNQARTLLEVV